MRRNKIDLPNKNSKVILEKLANAQKQEPQKLNSLGEPQKSTDSEDGNLEV